MSRFDELKKDQSQALKGRWDVNVLQALLCEWKKCLSALTFASVFIAFEAPADIRAFVGYLLLSSGWG